MNLAYLSDFIRVGMGKLVCGWVGRIPCTGGATYIAWGKTSPLKGKAK